MEEGSVIDRGSEVGSVVGSDDEANGEDQQMEGENIDDVLDDTFADATIDASAGDADRTTLGLGPAPRISLASRGSSASRNETLAPRSRQVSRQVSTSISASSASSLTSRMTRAGSSEEVPNASNNLRNTRSRIASNALKQGDPNIKRRSSDEALPLPQINIKSKNKSQNAIPEKAIAGLGLGLPASKRMKQI